MPSYTLIIRSLSKRAGPNSISVRPRHLSNHGFSEPLSRYSSQWREEADVQFRSDRVHPVLVTRDETYERADRDPLVRVPHPSERPPACLLRRLQKRPRIQEGSEGTRQRKLVPPLPLLSGAEVDFKRYSRSSRRTTRSSKELQRCSAPVA